MPQVTRHGVDGAPLTPSGFRVIRNAATAEPPRRRRDPAPSRLKYRFDRLMMRPGWRRAFRIGGPVLLVALLVGGWLADDGNRSAIGGWVQDRVQDVQHREAFMVKRMQIQGASPAVDEGLRAMLPVDLPASSFDLDLKALRQQALSLDAIETLDLRIKDGGVLEAIVTERTPAILWRHTGGIDMLDAGGHRVASVTTRELRQDLPLIAGLGGDKATPQALALFEIAGPILPRLRGLERWGERRWDVVLDNGQRIMLPADDAERALREFLVLNEKQDVLGRDVLAVDLRDGDRPMLRIGIAGQNGLRAARGRPLLGPDGRELPPEDKKS
ncbi:MAG: cell division protein FtsQ/DivIB [Paracoccus sp. (in: a-proteobacteria)]|uniref:cell division protein FtsQ/DivIB n=1 Tax=Paracoccus sp. TaxID=267 RepID=UPI0026DF2562|nr:cell division protein FtsQ/DivIB [Paracoccus sp. (in: a-proteobacteria)]MDO5620153.1 cell division protein FtsQ/DivIB [Paracoccus sp. (in: a-proteobacteria)]